MINNINILKNKLDDLIQKNREYERILRDLDNQKNKLEKQNIGLKQNNDQVNKNKFLIKFFIQKRLIVK